MIRDNGDALEAIALMVAGSKSAPLMKGKKMGTRITLLHTSDSGTKLKSGDRGTLRSSRIDPWGDRVISVLWDCGSTLSLIEGHDVWREDSE
jgi:hypothetical protein